MREVCLCNVLQIILKNSLACQFRIVCTEHKNAFATKQEGVHIGNADACLAEGGNSISRSSRSIVDFKGKAIFEQLKCTTAWRECFLQVVALLRVVFKFDAMKASPTFDIELEDIQSPEATLGKIFRYLEEADCPCIVAIDEFHQVTAYTEQNTASAHQFSSVATVSLQPVLCSQQLVYSLRKTSSHRPTSSIASTTSSSRSS